MALEEIKAYIEDNFRYLISHIGTCLARYVDGAWTVSLNGRLYTQQPSPEALFIFQCKTEYGTVSVVFPG